MNTLKIDGDYHHRSPSIVLSYYQILFSFKFHPISKYVHAVGKADIADVESTVEFNIEKYNYNLAKSSYKIQISPTIKQLWLIA